LHASAHIFQFDDLQLFFKGNWFLTLQIGRHRKRAEGERGGKRGAEER
jgi:hypothetical protein